MASDDPLPRGMGEWRPTASLWTLDEPMDTLTAMVGKTSGIDQSTGKPNIDHYNHEGFAVTAS